MKISSKPVATAAAKKPTAEPKPVKLTAANQKKLLSAYHTLAKADRIDSKKIAAMPIGAQFAQVPAGMTNMSISFGKPVTLLVPEGALSPGVKADPNKAKDFYVQYGPSTNSPGGIYGPFSFNK